MNSLPYSHSLAYMEEVRQAAQHVLHVFEDSRSYPEPGSFTYSLITTMALADESNLGSLVRAFPLVGMAFTIWKNKGADALRKWGGLNA